MIQVEKDGQTFELYRAEHMLHHENLSSVLTHGLLSHKEAHEKGLVKQDISMEEVQRWRRRKTISVKTTRDSKKHDFDVHDFVPFYFNSRNPMMYRRKELCPEMLVLIVNIDILNEPNNLKRFTAFSDGNMGASKSKYFLPSNELSKLDLKLILGSSWNAEDEEVKKENRRKMCAEVLVYPRVEVSEITHIICPNQAMFDFAKKQVQAVSAASHIEVAINSRYFFL